MTQLNVLFTPFSPESDWGPQVMYRIRCVLLLVLLCHVIHVGVDMLSMPGTELGPDGLSYLTAARNLRARTRLLDPSAFEGGVMQPLWPLTITALWTLFGESLTSVRVLNYAFWLLLLAVSFKASSSFLGPVGRCLAVLFVSRHELFHWIAFPQYELFLTLVCTMATAAFLIGLECNSDLWFLCSGIGWGFAGLIQARVLPMAALLPLTTLLFNRSVLRARAIVFMWLSTLSVMCVFAAFNVYVHGHVSFWPANCGYNLLVGNNPNATGCYTALPPEMMLPASTDDQAFDRDSRYRDEALDWMIRNPMSTLALIPHKLWFLWGLERRVNQVTLLLVAIGITISVRGKQKLAIALLVSPLLYVSALHGVFFGEGRFRFWVLPYVHILTATAVMHVVAMISERLLRNRIERCPIR